MLYYYYGAHDEIAQVATFTPYPVDFETMWTKTFDFTEEIYLYFYVMVLISARIARFIDEDTPIIMYVIGPIMMFICLNVLLVKALSWISMVGLYMKLVPFDIYSAENQDEWLIRTNCFLLLSVLINFILVYGSDTYSFGEEKKLYIAFF
jgi:hypothetical protein